MKAFDLGRSIIDGYSAFNREPSKQPDLRLGPLDPSY